MNSTTMRWDLKFIWGGPDGRFCLMELMCWTKLRSNRSSAAEGVAELRSPI
jgi:hypothetical protein